MTNALKAGNLALAFLLELALLAAFALWGASRDLPAPARIALAVAVPLAAASGWGAVLAPRALRRLRRPWLEAAKLLLYVLGGLALAQTGHPRLGAALVVVAAASLALAAWWGQEDVAGRPA
jgi:hypothetical protein